MSRLQSRRSTVAAGELVQAIEVEGLSPFDFEADSLMGATDCEEGCTVESDGICPHGYESAGITAGVI